jgi:hypothetical protein
MLGMCVLPSLLDLVALGVQCLNHIANLDKSETHSAEMFS